MTLCLAPIILNTIDVIFPAFFVDKQGAVVDPVMFKIAHIQYIVARKIIGIDDAVRVNF